MKKVITLALSLSLISASCSLFGSTGPQGMLKSEDGGQTYKTANAVDPEGDISKVNINVLTMDMVNTDVMYIGSSSGVHKTDNGANTWKYMLKGIRIGDIVLDPTDSNIVYASGVSDENGRVVKSMDGGSTWKDIYTEPTQGNPVLTVAVSLANPQIVIAGLNNGEIVRSTDSGATWQGVKDLGAAITNIEFIDPGTVYALTSGGLYSSIDQGVTWTSIPAVIKNTTVGTPAYRLASTQTFHDADFDRRSPGTIYLAAEQGLLKTTDAGKTWNVVNLPVSNQTLPVSAVAINPINSSHIVLAIGSTIFKTTNNGETWDTRKLSSEQRVRHIIFDPESTNIIYLGMGEKN